MPKRKQRKGQSPQKTLRTIVAEAVATTPTSSTAAETTSPRQQMRDILDSGQMKAFKAMIGFKISATDLSGFADGRNMGHLEQVIKDAIKEYTGTDQPSPTRKTEERIPQMA